MTDVAPTTQAQLRAHFPDLPQSPLIDRAFDYARDRCPAFLFNHAARSWMFAAKLAMLEDVAHDAEILAVSTLLHDLGLTEHAVGPNRFEVNGAGVAATFVREQGFDDRRAQLVWDSIALHATPSIGVFKEPEVALCARGVGADFGTPDNDLLGASAIALAVAAAPRLDMKRRFTACVCHMAETKPETTYPTFIRDFGERLVPGYKAPSWVDVIANGPFSE
ncbi:hypothetical protein [Caulobacter sp. BE254]|uniref:hypothetical protein n=1 Tax=Caulobacter sp. BE254 TaxID=2817720 RepID=UPI0028655D1A|nr:hypothetical protein [Caulobacter sp. BE254]MDR7116126.1 hypothetical protein [Caulobacter sp. BE254]